MNIKLQQRLKINNYYQNNFKKLNIFIYFYQNKTNLLMIQRKFLFCFFSENIRKAAESKQIINGVTNDNPKLDKVSLIRYICVFLYTKQKQEI